METIRTIDGHELKYNERAWEIGVIQNSNVYAPTLSVNNRKSKNNISNPNKVYKDYFLAKLESDRLTEERKLTVN